MTAIARGRRVMAVALGAVALCAMSTGPGTGGAQPRQHAASGGPAVDPPAVDAPAAGESAEQWARNKLRHMSLREKVGQLFVTYAYGRTADTEHPSNREEFGVATPAEVVRRYHLGGIIHFSWTDSLYQPRQIAKLSNGLQRAAVSSGAGIPLTISTDQEQGLVTRIGKPATQLPGNMALGAARSPRHAREAAAITGGELRAMGFTQNFAPVGDVNVNPRNPVIGVRSFSSDPDLAARLTAAQVRGYQRSGDDRSSGPDRSVSATVKHFPGHGDTTQDSHTSLPVIEHSREQWEELDAPPFRAAIDAGTDSVMSAHILLPKIDDSGEPATLSHNILTGMLREQLGFDGVITTDSLQMQGVRELHPNDPISVLALRAGADQLLMPKNLPNAIDSVLRAVRSGELTEQRIDSSVRRILTMKARRGALHDPFVDVEAVDEVVGSAQHRQQAQRITDRTVTALSNEAGLLPLPKKPESVLVTGWGEDATAALADRIGSRGPSTTSLPTGASPNRELIDRAVSRARDQELTVVLTNAAWREDRAGQRELLRELHAAGVPVVAVAVRDPYDAAYVDRVGTWLATYSHKAVSMESVARVMFGEISPSGELPVPVPEPGEPGSPRYPLGHGLTW